MTHTESHYMIENYLKKLVEKQTQIKRLVPNSLKENGKSGKKMIDLDKLRESKGYMLAIVNTKTGEYEPVSEDVMPVTFEKFRSVCKYFAVGFDQDRQIEYTCRRKDMIPEGCSWGICDKGHCPYMQEEKEQ